MAKIVYSKSNGKLVKKWRCTKGKRKGKLVSEPSGCFKPIDLKKRARMKKTRRQKGAIISKKSQITKSHDPLSKQVSRLNKIINDRLSEDDTE